jgi:hypothetical protein
LIREEDEDIGGAELKTQLLKRINDSINYSIDGVLRTLPQTEFFIFNPNMNQSLYYKIEYKTVSVTFESGLPGYIDLQKIDNI